MRPIDDRNFDVTDPTEGFLQLLNQHERALNAYILALNPHWADAEDIMQETRLRLWRQFDKYQPGTDFCAWARSVAFFLVLEHRKKNTRDRLRFGDSFYQAVAKTVAAKPNCVTARQEALLGCMEKLDSAKRILIEDYYSEERSLRELAEQQNRSYDSVRKAVYRAQVALFDCIRSQLREKESDE